MEFVISKDHAILVKGVTYEEYQGFLKWQDQQSWDIGGGYLFPMSKEDQAILFLDGGLSYGATWRDTIQPALIEFFGEQRVIHPGEWGHN